MAYDYDALYKSTPNALGKPTKFITNFFDQFEGASLRVLDIGCGQGRDALFIARLGHSVVGVDLSPNGISCLNAAASIEDLPIEGIVADIRDYNPSCKFDILLIDRTLHMLAKKERTKVFVRLIDCIIEKGWLIVLDEPSNIPDFIASIEASKTEWRITLKQRGNLIAQKN